MRRLEHPLSRFKVPILLVLAVVVYGTGGYMLIERWNLLDGFFMTLITISTVGYEEVHRLTPAGRIFTSSLILVGVGTMLYGFGVFAELIGEGYLPEYRRQRKLQREIGSMRDHFIVCGYGRMGTRVVAEFAQNDVPYVVIDTNPDAIQRLRDENQLHIEGDAAAEDVLRAAGIERARALISTVDSDERAVYITLAARALNPSLVLMARAGQPQSIRRLELAGANRVISPYLMAGHRMAEAALRPGLIDVTDSLTHGDNDVGVGEVMIGEQFANLGRTLQGAGALGPSLAKVIAVRRSDGTLHVNPEPALPLRAGDMLIALGSRAELERLASLLQ